MSTTDATNATSEEPAGLARALTPVAALLLGTAMLYLGYGLQATLVPLRADQEGFTRLVIGVLGSVYYLGFIAGCLFAPYLILRSGHIRAFAAMVALVSAAALAFPLLVGAAPWVLFRFAIGFCISGLLVIIESWLNEKATNRTRGTIMSTYVVITYVTIFIGQLGVTAGPLEGFALFSVCSILMSLAAVPVALTRASQPAPIPLVRFEPLLLFRLAPAAFAGTFVAGLMAGSMFSVGALYAVDVGFSVSEAALFVSAAVLGGALSQYPFGRVSDLVDRRLVLLVASVGSAATALLLAFPGFMGEGMLLAAGVGLGLFLFPTYSLAAAHAFDWTERENMVQTSAGLILLYGIGSAVGPLAASLAMLAMGPGGLFLLIATGAAALALFIALRLFARRRPDEEMRSDFDIFSTAPVGGALTPEPLEGADPAVGTPHDYRHSSAGDGAPEGSADREQDADRTQVVDREMAEGFATLAALVDAEPVRNATPRPGDDGTSADDGVPDRRAEPVA